jgi:hypothetical protein
MFKGAKIAINELVYLLGFSQNFNIFEINFYFITTNVVINFQFFSTTILELFLDEFAIYLWY